MAVTVVDAGVLIAILNADDTHHDVARAALSTARDRGDRLVVPASAYAEVMVAPFRATEQASLTVDQFLDAIPAVIEPATRLIARDAARLRATHGKRLRLPDALVLGTAIALKADRVLTTDAGWPELGVAVEVIGPGST
jgi:predicted nucleic acid-binding protein